MVECYIQSHKTRALWDTGSHYKGFTEVIFGLAADGADLEELVVPMLGSERWESFTAHSRL